MKEEEKEIKVIILRVLEELGIFATLQKDGVITIIAHSIEISGTERKIALQGEILTKDEEVMMLLYFGLIGEPIIEKSLREEIERIDSSPSFYRNGARWMRIGPGENLLHLVIAAQLIDSGEKINPEIFKDRILLLIENIKNHWPLKIFEANKKSPR